MYAVRWELEYPGGLLRTEPPNGETILHAPKRYTALRLVDSNGHPVQRIVLPVKTRPIFYRIKSVDPKHNEQGSRLDATVFGYGDDPELVDYDQRGDLTLWIWNWQTGQAENLPQHLFREGAVNHLLQSPIGV